jgi:hypothetical protein
MGNRLPYGLGGRGHCVHMLGGDEGEVNQDGSMGVRITGSLCWSGGWLVRKAALVHYSKQSLVIRGMSVENNCSAIVARRS